MITAQRTAADVRHAPPPRPVVRPHRLRFERAWALLGLALLIGVLAAVASGWRWASLELLQTRPDYRAASGTLLLGFIALQWTLAWRRTHSGARLAADQLRRHRWLGTLAPVLYYLHSTGLGYAYTFALAVVYLANSALGFLNQDTLGVKSKTFALSWLVAHVLLSCAMTALALFHLWVVVYYK